MPPYNGSGSGSMVPNTVMPTVLFPGDQKYLFGTTPQTPGQVAEPNDGNVQYEAVAVGEASIAVALASIPGRIPGCIVQIVANGNPGAAEMDIQDAAVDADGAYILQTSSAAYKITAWAQIGATGIYIANAEFQPEGGAFIRIKCIANPNAVSFTAKIKYV